MNIWNIGKNLARLSLAAALLLGCTGVQAQDPRNFSLLNNTGKQIREFYVSPHEVGDWGPDGLGVTTLPDGWRTLISFDRGGLSSCVMDFKLVFSDGSKQFYAQGRDVCRLNAVQFNWDDSIGWPLS
jgi:hypothetical protein